MGSCSIAAITWHAHGAAEIVVTEEQGASSSPNKGWRHKVGCRWHARGARHAAAAAACCTLAPQPQPEAILGGQRPVLFQQDRPASRPAANDTCRRRVDKACVGGVLGVVAALRRRQMCVLGTPGRRAKGLTWPQGARATLQTTLQGLLGWHPPTVARWGEQPSPACPCPQPHALALPQGACRPHPPRCAQWTCAGSSKFSSSESKDTGRSRRYLTPGVWEHWCGSSASADSGRAELAAGTM